MVALFVPCYVKAVAPEVIAASYKLLRYLGVDVEIPEGQTCCGQPMGNAGYEASTRHMKQRFEKLFEKYDVVVGPSSSCVVYAREHYDGAFDGRIYEMCEYIHDVLKPTSLPGSFPHRVSLHNSCHGTRLEGLVAPSELNIPYFSKLKDLLALIDGVEVVEPERPDECCGFGGLFCVEESAVSTRMGLDKVRRHAATGAEFITGADCSCLMHQSAIARKNGISIEFKHVAEILAAGL